MSTVTLETLRWRDPPARATVKVDGGAAHVALQMTTPRQVEVMCLGRPIEELPRILSILSPAHHLCAAQLLDGLFGLEPSPAARSAREAMRLALVYRHHLRKFHFLVSSAERPFAEFRAEGTRRGPHGLRPLLDDLARHVSLAQEAATILGGRADHPVTAVAGGFTRALRDEHLTRLADIAAACLGGAERLAGFVRERVFAGGELLGDARTLLAGPLASLALGAGGDVVVRDAGGAVLRRFSPAALQGEIGFHHAASSHEPFAFLKASGWNGVKLPPPDGLFFVGPLARLAAGEPAATPRAEAERKRLVEALGPLPRFEVVAAWWALLVEALGAAEALAEVCAPERLAGAAARATPTRAPAAEGCAALEAPQGLVWQQVRVGARGVVEELRVLDAATANNALLGIVAQRSVERALDAGRGWNETKGALELALLAY